VSLVEGDGVASQETTRDLAERDRACAQKDVKMVWVSSGTRAKPSRKESRSLSSRKISRRSITRGITSRKTPGASNVGWRGISGKAHGDYKLPLLESAVRIFCVTSLSCGICVLQMS